MHVDVSRQQFLRSTLGLASHATTEQRCRELADELVDELARRSGRRDQVETNQVESSDRRGRLLSNYSNR